MWGERCDERCDEWMIVDQWISKESREIGTAQHLRATLTKDTNLQNN